MKKITKKDREIIGFLFADGCCEIIKQNIARCYKDKVYRYIRYIPRVTVTQREDNRKVLEYFQKRFGGYVSENRSLKPFRTVGTFYWVAQDFERCKIITDLMIRGFIPHKKKKAAKILNQFCKWKLKSGALTRKYTPNEREKIKKWHQQIREINQFKGVTN